MSDTEQPFRPTWRRKTAAEGRRDRRWQTVNPIQCILMAVISGAVGALVGAIATIMAEGSFGEIFVFSAVIAIVFGMPAFFLAYFLQFFGWIGRPGPPRVGICNACFKLTTDGQLSRCGCGGEFEDSDGWTLNQCPRCRYDLRGTPNRCPECGTHLSTI